MTKLLLVTVLAIATVLMSGRGDCSTEHEPATGRNYRQDMRDFVQGISIYIKRIKSSFIVIPQNGHELMTENGEETGTLAAAYLDAIDGVGREDLFYGYDDDDAATPALERGHMVSFLDIAEKSVNYKVKETHHYNPKQTHLHGWRRKILIGLGITRFNIGIRIGRTLFTGKMIPISKRFSMWDLMACI